MRGGKVVGIPYAGRGFYQDQFSNNIEPGGDHHELAAKFIRMEASKREIVPGYKFNLFEEVMKIAKQARLLG